MFGRRARCKWESGVDSTVASHLELAVVAYEQEPTNCWDFDAVCAARVNALLKHFDLDDDNNFMRDDALRRIVAWKMCRKEEKEKKKKSEFAAYIPLRGYCSEWPNRVHIKEGLIEPHK